jgi:hypothetical protein
MAERSKASPALLLLLCALALSGPVAGAGAEGIVPVQGGWVGKTSAGLPVSFVVKEGNVLNAHFGFRWGFCGSFESHLPNTDPIDAGGHWSFEDPRGQTIEATFLAPDRAEGTVVTVGRELPGCPETSATFLAAPGEAPALVKPQVFAVQNANTGRLAKRPREIVLGEHGTFSFHGLRWLSFGGPQALASGRASIRRGGREWEPRAAVRLGIPIDAGAGRRVYSVVHYVLRGPVPTGFARRGSLFVG